jgi:hypothetical protein
MAKKRRIFFILVAVAPLSIVVLCLTSFYFRDVACVIIYWALLVLLILVTLAVAGRQYIREMVNGRPAQKTSEPLVVDLEGRWWDSLAPMDLVDEKPGAKKGVSFQDMLSRSLPDTCILQSLSLTDFLLFGPSGVWIFIVLDWPGSIFKQGGLWTQSETVRDKLGRKGREEKTQDHAPDDQWLNLKQKITQKIETYLLEKAETSNLVQGGVVFGHPKVDLDKKRIQDNTASYGPPKAWVERIRRALPLDNFNLERQLEILDALAEPASSQTTSAMDQAELLYHQAVKELREYISKLVK